MYERREAKRLADMSMSESELDSANGVAESSVSFSGDEENLAPMSEITIDPDDALYIQQLAEELLDCALDEIFEIEANVST